MQPFFFMKKIEGVEMVPRFISSKNTFKGIYIYLRISFIFKNLISTWIRS